MAEQKPAYERIGGNGLKFLFLPGVRSVLYAGPDHFLLVSNRIFAQRYRRLYFKDIVAIAAAKSNRWIWAAVGWACCVPFGALFLLGNRAVFFWIGAIWMAFFGVLLTASLICGPIYTVVIQTNVQKYRVAPVDRPKRFRRFVDQYAPRIREAQRRETADTSR